jgi:hypothetical protein
MMIYPLLSLLFIPILALDAWRFASDLICRRPSIDSKIQHFDVTKKLEDKIKELVLPFRRNW